MVSAPLLLVEIAHLCRVGVHRQVGADAAREEHHHFCLLDVGLQYHAVKESTEGVKGLLEEGGVAGYNKAIVGIEAF